MAIVATVRLLPNGRGIRWPAGQVLSAGFSQDYSAPDSRFVPHLPLALMEAGRHGELKQNPKKDLNHKPEAIELRFSMLLSKARA